MPATYMPTPTNHVLGLPSLQKCVCVYGFAGRSGRASVVSDWSQFQ